MKQDMGSPTIIPVEISECAYHYLSQLTDTSCLGGTVPGIAAHLLARCIEDMRTSGNYPSTGPSTRRTIPERFQTGRRAE